MSELRDVALWAEELIASHLDNTWSFAFDHARRRAGQCDYTNRRITVSRHLTVRLDDETNRQTLLHEIAHALVGPRVGHGARWQRVARQLGYRGDRVLREDPAADLAPWIGVCPAGHESHRFRRPTRVASCGRCSRRFDERHLVTWRRRENA